MHGYPLSESAADRWSRLASAVRLRRLLASAAVGVIAGLVVSHVRLHLGLPGHKVLLWLTPIVIARVLLKHPFGATVGVLSVACTSLALGENFAGGILFLPLVGIAGAIVDGAVAFAQKRHLPSILMVPLVGAAGATAGLACAVKRMLAPVVHTHVIFGLTGPPARLLSYAFFGLLAGLIGAGVAVIVRKARRGVNTSSHI